VTVSVPASAPVWVGAKLTVMVQVALAASDEAQVLVWVKELALVPPMAAPLKLRAPVPVFESVTVWVAAVDPTLVLAKVRVVGLTVAV